MNDVTLAILAGGEGSRMGRPKGELLVGDRPILQYLLDRFAWSGPTLLITAPGREHPPGWERFGAEAVDPVAGQGPLRGVLTALENVTTQRLVVTTIDMPGFGASHLRWIVDRAGPVITMLRRREQIEPFPSVFPTAAAPMIRAELDAGRFSVQALSRQAAVESVPAPADWDEFVWTNLNHPDEFDRFLTRLSRSSRGDR